MFQCFLWFMFFVLHGRGYMFYLSDIARINKYMNKLK